MKIWKNTLLFCLGGGAYVCLELLWRGRSHGSMFLLGGLCFRLIGWLEQKLQRFAPTVRMVAGAASVTALELGTGLLVNRDHRIWDYRQLPMNYRGQICLVYSLLWLPVVLAGMVLYRCADRILSGTIARITGNSTRLWPGNPPLPSPDGPAPRRRRKIH